MSKSKIIKKSVLSPTVLIAGGAGFIGANLAEALLEQNVNVVVVDNMDISGKEIHIENLLKNPHFAFFDADINRGIPAEIKSVDYVFHLTGVETYMYSDGWGLDTLLANSLGTKNLLDFAKDCEAKFLLVSSTDVYQGMMASQNLNNYFGKTEYEEKKYSLIEAKRYAEALVWEYFKKFDMDARIVRLPKVYGPRMPLNSSDDLNTTLKDLLDDKNLKLLGEGIEKNYYLYITDAISGIIKAILTENTKGKIYSLVTNEPYSTLEMVYILKGMASRELNIEFKAKTLETSSRFIEPDISNLFELNWEAKTEFKEGLQKTLKWYGYEINEYSFKPAKLIAEKNKSKAETIIPVEINAYNEEQNTVAEEKEKKSKSKPTLNKKKATKTSNTGKKFNFFRNTVVAVIFLMFILVVLPFGQTYFYANKAVNSIKNIETDLKSLNLENAQTNSNNAYVNFQRAQNSLKITSVMFRAANKAQTYNAVQNTLNSMENFSKATYFATVAAEPVQNIWGILRIDLDDTLTSSQIEEMNFNLDSAKSSLLLANAIAKEIDANQLPQNVRPQINEYKKVINTFSTSIEDVEVLTKNLADIIGTEEPKKYLVLFQNPNEIRPTGGFIGSYATIEMEKGKIKNLKIDDIYNPDGQLDLKNFVNPAPEPMQILLGEKDMHLRNANWNPDFNKTSKEIFKLFEQVDGSKFDGIIAIDLEVVKRLLTVTGPIFLTAYNEEITADNLYEKTQFYSEFNYKEGESQKRAFLTVLTGKLLEKLFAIENPQIINLVEVLKQSLEEKHILISVNNSKLANIVDKYNWDGSLQNSRGDYLNVINANLSGNKANFYIDQSTTYQVASLTRDGVLRGKVTVEYDHKGKDFAWPGGEYDNYLRIYTKKGTKLTGARIEVYEDEKLLQIDDELPRPKPENKFFTEGFTDEQIEFYEHKDENPLDILEKVKTTQEGNYTVYSLFVQVLPQQKVKVTVDYDLPKEIRINNGENNYELLWQKQPGQTNKTYTFELQPPLGKNIIEAGTAKKHSKTFKITEILNKDKNIKLTIK